MECLVAERPVTAEDEAAVLRDLIAYLKQRKYQFITPTPATHARVLARSDRQRAADLRDVFGWSLPFVRDLLDASLLEALEAAGLIEAAAGDQLRSKVRVSTLGRDLLVHSAYPTDDTDAVFFGPDSYRFARFIADELRRCPEREGSTLVDIGTGAGAGAIAAAHRCPRVDIVMTDINPAALRLARVNAQAAGVATRFVQGDDLSGIAGELDLVLANPPYIIDPVGRAYRDGGALHGAGVALAMACEAVPRLAAGGRFLLYTGSAIVRGADALHDRLVQIAAAEGCRLRYEEIDPDVFGEELETAAYADVDRIALVTAVIERPNTC
ncbi:methyltransferase domain-containing protein [Sphingomonas sp. ABOLD]|uniref:Methylase of polypeptide subunit release factors n=2 Tax=Sphingomonas trueperi TaxID=53317 RepID=A0A7X5XZY2_9SPHN|nr:methyltransferase [Sphingomonas sp. ABOLD]NJB96921.1 methylase of polypeptide subunit release factors [Sphingomonas trueperi]RSV35888.1 methyltransferase domain-containing protein [Sphingomonas sp. ABOLD]